MSDPAAIFERAKPDTLVQIRKEADAYLGAQLTVALASNQRAMTFLGFLAAASAVIGSASITVIATNTDFAAFGFVGTFVVCGLLTAMLLSSMAAMPDDFYYVGNSPSNWAADLDNEISTQRSIAESIALDIKSINHNTNTIERCSNHIRRAIWVAWGSLTAGGLGMVLVFAFTHS